MVAGRVFFPLEYRRRLLEARSAFREVATAGDVRRLPWPYDGFRLWVDEAEPERLDDDQRLPDGWDEDAWGGDYPFRTHLPWEVAGSPYDYDKWMPPQIMALTGYDGLTSPMQETARWTFEDDQYQDVVERFRLAGWTVLEQPQLIDEVIVGYD